MTNWEKFKRWTNDHREAIANATIIGAGIGTLAYFVVASNKSQAELAKIEGEIATEFAAWTKQKHSEGFGVFPLATAIPTLLAVPGDTKVTLLVPK